MNLGRLIHASFTLSPDPSPLEAEERFERVCGAIVSLEAA
jgi:hypothetical protein